MAVIRCKMCGGDLVIEEGSSVAVCEYCGTKQTVPTADNEKKMTLFGRANRLLRNCEFDKASGIYESIVAEFPEEAEAYWCLVLCKYGIEYVDDPATDRKVPTCHRSSFESVLEDKDVELAMEYADLVARRVYRDEAKQIEELRKTIIEVSGKEEPYDIFISYKETDENGDRTLDSVIAQDIYDALTDKGYRVFFSRISLEDKLGTEYEPYIFAALNSAKVMLCVGTDYEYFNAVWVKNEWSRFLSLIGKGEKKVLIPVFKNIDAYDMPKEFAKLSAQNMDKVGAMQDLLRGVDKIIGKKETAPNAVASQQVVQTIVQSNGVTANSLLERGNLFLEDRDWSSADEYFNKVLDIEPKNAEAYLGKMLAEMKLTDRAKLKEQNEPFNNRSLYGKVVRFGGEALIAEMEEYNSIICERNEIARKTEIYNKAVTSMKSAKSKQQFEEAAEVFKQISGFKDADELRKCCLEEFIEEYEYLRAINLMKSATGEWQFEAAIKAFEQVTGYKDADELRERCLVEIRENKYVKAINLMKSAISEWQFEAAIKAFEQVTGYKDADELREECMKELKECQYTSAANLLDSAENKQQCEDAAKIFERLSGYKDADELRERCLELSLSDGQIFEEAKRKNAVYIECIKLINGAGGRISQLEAAKEGFESILDWRDSGEKVKQCETYIIKAKEKEEQWQKGAEQRAKQERIETERRRKENERRAELERFEAEKRRKEAERKAREEKIAALTKEKAKLQAELPNLQGIFKSSRRKEAEARLAEIDKELKQI